MQESHLRSFLKALSWRTLATLTTVLITFFITHQIDLAIYVGIFEFISKIFLYYAHERMWNWISLGKNGGLIKST